MRPRFAFALAVALMALACSSLQPAKIQVGDRCYSCKQPIQDLKLAVAYIDQQNSQYPFRSPMCMAKFLKDHPTEKGVVFVTDHNSGNLFEAEKAWFVSVAIPKADGYGNEPNYFAFRDVHDAEKANTTGAPLQRWAAIVAAAH